MKALVQYDGYRNNTIRKCMLCKSCGSGNIFQSIANSQNINAKILSYSCSQYLSGLRCFCFQSLTVAVCHARKEKCCSQFCLWNVKYPSINRLLKIKQSVLFYIYRITSCLKIYAHSYSYKPQLQLPFYCSGTQWNLPISFYWGI